VPDADEYGSATAMDRYNKWLRRSMESVDGVPVSAMRELWRAVPKHPANDWVRRTAAAEGRTVEDDEIAYYTSRTLRLDVIHAAGAIEHTVERIAAAHERVQAYATEHGARARDNVPSHMRTREVDAAYIEYANLLTWLRTLSDRMRSKDPRGGATLGLIPALREGEQFRREVETIFDRFQRHPLVKDEVNLTNFGLHLHALPGGGLPVAHVTSEGTIRLPIPDKPKDRVYLFDQFTYDDGRDMLGYARDLLDVVTAFVDELLTAFEHSTRRTVAAGRKATS
jgi:hypothetical protein